MTEEEVGEPTLLPPCFGTLWQATGETFCDTCSAQHECLIEFVSTTMLAAVERIGGAVTPTMLAADLRIPRAAVISALDFARSHRGPDQQVVVEPSQPAETDQAIPPPKKKRKYTKPRVKKKPGRKPAKKKAPKKTKASKKRKVKK